MTFSDTHPGPILTALTPAERLVAVHLADGLSNKEIAGLLGKAEPTVKHQVSSILRTSGAGSRCRFIAAYYRQFVCPLPVADSHLCIVGRDAKCP
jgi:DNA-binding NarL/FixJ family response regulator